MRHQAMQVHNSQYHTRSCDPCAPVGPDLFAICRCEERLAACGPFCCDWTRSVGTAQVILYEKGFKLKLSGGEVYYTACSLLVI